MGAEEGGALSRSSPSQNSSAVASRASKTSKNHPPDWRSMRPRARNAGTNHGQSSSSPPLLSLSPPVPIVAHDAFPYRPPHIRMPLHLCASGRRHRAPILSAFHSTAFNLFRLMKPARSRVPRVPQPGSPSSQVANRSCLMDLWNPSSAPTR